MSIADLVAKEEPKVSQDQLHYVIRSKGYDSYYPSLQEATEQAERHALRDILYRDCKEEGTQYVYKLVKKVTVTSPSYIPSIEREYT